MKVIKKGIGSEWWIGKYVDCDYCHAIMEIESKDDVKTSTSLETYFTCPECGKENTIKPALKSS